MSQRRSMSRFVFVFGCFVLVSISLLSIVIYLIVLPDNMCLMTYMFQYPEYIEIPLSKETVGEFPNYRLFSYGEGTYAEQLRRKQYDGLPVLFIPGNAGSHKQVRSLASVSLKKTESKFGTLKFNYFSVDFDEELSGLYGGYLFEQTKFVSKCVHRIFQLYPKNLRKDIKIALIGHSMGGLVAKGVVWLNLLDANKVSIIYTLATANVKPVLNFDQFLKQYYFNIFSAANATVRSTNISNSLLYVSVAGGIRDVMVRSDLTPMQSAQPDLDLAITDSVSSSLTHVWSSADHLCIVWCNQLVRLVVRSLFDVYDKRLNNDIDLKRRILDYHFRKNLGPNSAVDYVLGKFDNVSVLNAADASIEYLDYFVINEVVIYPLQPKLKNKWLKICIKSDDRLIDNVLFLRTNQVDVYCIVYTCPAASSKENCDYVQCEPNHHVLPPSSKYLHIRLQKNYCYYVPLSNLRSNSIDYLIYSIYNNDTAKKNDAIRVGNRFWWNYVRQFDGRLGFFNLSLSGFSSVSQAFNIKLVPKLCRTDSLQKTLLSAVQFHCSWLPSQNLYHIFGLLDPYNSTDDFIIFYQFVKENTDIEAQLLLFFDLNCDYELHISSAPLISLRQIVNFYFEYMLSVCVVLLLLAIVAKIFLSSSWSLHYAALIFPVIYYTIIYNSTDDLLFGDLTLLVICFGILIGLQFVCSLLICLPKALFRRFSFQCSFRFTTVANLLVAGLCFVLCWTTCGYICLLILSLKLLITKWFDRTLLFSTNITTAFFSLHVYVIHLTVWLLVLTAPTFIVWLKQIGRGAIQLSIDPTTNAAILSIVTMLLFLEIKSLPFYGRHLLVLIAIFVHKFPYMEFKSCALAFSVNLLEGLIKHFIVNLKNR